VRPLRLELVSFRSYDRETVDWTPFDLVVISGDTGAGKTSLLDAIAFALYGRTPETARSGDLLTLGATHGEVRLTFALRDEVWRVTRRFGVRAPDPARVLERLEGGPDGATLELVDDGVDDRLRVLLGLGFEAFTSTVLLAQGRFARFLAAAPRDRDAILRELFAVAPLEGAREAALRAQGRLTGEADGLERAASALPPHDPGTWWAAARAARAAAARRAALARLAPRAAEAARREAAAQALRAEAAGVREAAAGLPDAAALDGLRDRLHDLGAAVAAAGTAVASAAADHDAAHAARELLRVRHGGDAAELGTLLGAATRYASLSEAVPRLEAEAARAREDVAAREAARARAQEEGARLAEAHRGLLARRDRLAALVAAVAAGAAAAEGLEAADTALTASAGGHDAALRARDAARRALEDAVRDDGAAALRAGLAPGDPCPVCGSPVGEHLPEGAGADIAGLRRAQDDAARAEREAGGRRAGAAARRERAADDAAAAIAALEAARTALGEDVPDPGAALAACESRVAEDAGRLEEARAAFAAERGALDALAASLRDGERRLADDAAEHRTLAARLGAWCAHADPEGALAAALAEVREAEEALAAAARARDGALRRREEARGALHALETGELGRLRGALARVAASAGLPAPPDDAAAADLLDACAGVRAAAVALAAARDDAAGAEAGAAAAVRAAIAEAGAPLGVTRGEEVAAALRSARDEERRARADLALAADAAARARGLAGEAAAARARAALHGQVALDLRANNFPRHLLGRFRERLATGASVRLQEMSHGAFRFAGTGADPLLVIDVRRGEQRRPTSTLSGGERFLASLSLALGLADIAAESGGRLDCLFLDEGFSTLDAESLEQALGGVERLAGDGRLVAVITHLPGVAERLGASLRVAKDAAGVSRVLEDSAA
jgi:exonuclease SbcC